jgi:thiamine biosynthesis protein ThiI
LKENADTGEMRRRLEAVFGVANFSFVERTPREIEALASAIVRSVDGRRFDSFRVETKRGDKTFPFTSPEINARIGAAVQTLTGSRVDLTGADFTISVEILPDDAFFSFDKIPGAGGLPVGASGRVAALISGGFDSPVAAYRMMRRGCRVCFIHFHSAPYLDKTSQEKVRALVQHLTRYQYASRLYLVPFGEVQRQIVAAVLRPLRVVLYRRTMIRIAEVIARKERTRALVTGESLGQVASQTLENLTVIEEAAAMPLLRPLIGMDKQEIIDQARSIGTFDLSAVPDQDCCQLFVPAHPATKAALRDVKAAEAALDVDGLTQLGAGAAEVAEFTFPPNREES